MGISLDIINDVMSSRAHLLAIEHVLFYDNCQYCNTL